MNLKKTLDAVDAIHRDKYIEKVDEIAVLLRCPLLRDVFNLRNLQESEGLDIDESLSYLWEMREAIEGSRVYILGDKGSLSLQANLKSLDKGLAREDLTEILTLVKRSTGVFHRTMLYPGGSTSVERHELKEYQGILSQFKESL